MSTELIFGLVGPIGVDLDEVTASVERALLGVGYKTEGISLIRLALSFIAAPDASHAHFDKRAGARMDVGNTLRQELGREDALALLAATRIRAFREAEEKADRRVAYILRSLKTKAEVATLRKIYGHNFILVAGYSPKSTRLKTLSEQIAHSHNVADNDRYLPEAQRLIRRDIIEHGNAFGQNVRDVFPLADVFVDASDRGRLSADITRFVELLFGHPFRTPFRREVGMHYAYSASLRSASPGRQVGAAILTPNGDLLSVGTNEVAKAFGGQYWEGEPNDHRDHVEKTNVSSQMVEEMLVDLLARLRKKKWFSKKLTASSVEQLVEKARAELLKPMVADPDEPESLLETARFGHVIEFIRAVHAEMAALTSAAKLGTSIDGSELYCTTFPCHECARHIVAAGIRCVHFIEPYPKSRVVELFGDSIVVDQEPDDHHIAFQAYIGVAPHRFSPLFSAPERVHDGAFVQWERVQLTAEPRLGNPLLAYEAREKEYLQLLEVSLDNRNSLRHAKAKKSSRVRTASKKK